jgi:hypothetical protein
MLCGKGDTSNVVSMGTFLLSVDIQLLSSLALRHFRVNVIRSWSSKSDVAREISVLVKAHFSKTDVGEY